jgi:ADP-ribose pyrophosphatase
MHEILDRRIVFSTPWFNLVAKLLAGCELPFYAVQSNDYVSVLPVTASGNVVLVRQFRPAVEDYTLELPSGHVDNGESPEEAAGRELSEETGYSAGKLHFLGQLIPDSGRLGMRQWCYLATGLEIAPTARIPEPGIDVVEFNISDLMTSIRESKFNHALHVAVVMLWMSRDSRCPVIPSLQADVLLD